MDEFVDFSHIKMFELVQNGKSENTQCKIDKRWIDKWDKVVLYNKYKQM